MIIWDAEVTPDALTAFVRQVPPNPQLTLTGMFSRQEVMNNVVDWAEITSTNRTARYRDYDGVIHSSSRDGATEKKVPLAPLSSSLSMGEYERLKVEFLRTGGTRGAVLEQAIYNDAERLTTEVLNRYELAWGDVLTDGKLSINEGGFVAEMDYGVPGELVQTPSASWDIAGTALVTDLEAWLNEYVFVNGFMPGSILCSTRVQTAVKKNTSVINAVVGSAAGKPRVSRMELNEFMAGEGWPIFRDPYDTQLSVDGTSTRVIADDMIVFLPPNLDDLGASYWGVSATSLELVNSNEAEMTFEDAPGVVGVVEKMGPPYREYTFVDAVGMPVLTNASLLMVADVIA